MIKATKIIELTEDTMCAHDLHELENLTLKANRYGNCEGN